MANKLLVLLMMHCLGGCTVIGVAIDSEFDTSQENLPLTELGFEIDKAVLGALIRGQKPIEVSCIEAANQRVCEPNYND
ncbi:hypothetical protein [Pseudoalteromonas pernae]|uniref:hypothetical protein n=1 Tax=Pseudoalteromonas pernae TaxID=3118054 RepID=UPI003242C6DD